MARTPPKARPAPVTTRPTWRTSRRTPPPPPPSRGAKIGSAVKGRATSVAGGLALSALTAAGGVAFRAFQKRRAAKTQPGTVVETAGPVAPAPPGDAPRTY